jgi:dTDP-4-amino-4,6-dideoxygalactose transaminase
MDIRWCPEKRLSFLNFERYLSESIAARQLTNGGPLQRVLSSKLIELTDSRRVAIPAASGTAALHALAAALSLQANRRLRWATQAFTFPPATQGPFCDAVVVDNDDTAGGPSLEALSSIAAIDGVICTNVFGSVCDILFYERWCRENGKLCIFDNAATPVGCVGARSIHDCGDGAIVSLHETKPIGRGEGGVIFADAALAPFVQRALNFGFSPGDRVGDRMCSNYRMSDIAAAAICDHLDAVLSEDWVEAYRQRVAAAALSLNRHGLSLALGLQSPPCIPSCLVVALPGGACADAVVDALSRQERAVEAKHYYRPLAGPDTAPVAWALFEGTICMPFHLELSDEDIDYMIRSLVRVLSSGRCRRARDERAR